MRPFAVQLRISISFLIVCSVILFYSANASFHRDSLLFSVNSIFSDHMVLQREQPIHIWGKGLPGSIVQVSLAPAVDPNKISNHLQKQVAKSVVKKDSSWSVYLPAQSANAAPQTLQIASRKQKLQFKNILIGDVWLCIGQSNMEWPMQREMYYKDAIATAQQPLLRLYNPTYAGKNIFNQFFTDSVLQLLAPENFFAKTHWEVSDSHHFKTMSAVAYYYGKEIVEKTKVPVGLINLSIAGAPLETFIGTDALKLNPVFASKAMEPWLTNPYLPVWVKERGNQNLRTGTNHPFKPGHVYEAGIKPLFPFAIKGIINYQGESNAQEIERVNEYVALSALMVKDYRAKFKQPKLPYYFVQLSSIDSVKYKGQFWHLFRNEERKLLEQIPYSGMAVITDHGLRDNVHPTNKKIVGERLAQWALHNDYGKAVVPSGPLPDKAIYEKGQVKVYFKYAAGGLQTADGKLLRGFSLDGITAVAAQIDSLKNFEQKPGSNQGGFTVVIQSPTMPEYVYYDWKPYTDGNLVNNAGLPASTFKQEVLQSAVSSLNIIPAPVRLQQQKGAFHIHEQTAIEFFAQNKALLSAARFLQQGIREISGFTLPLKPANGQQKAGKPKIVLAFINDTKLGNEGYHLNVTPELISVQANTRAGIVYGIQSLMQTLPAVRNNAKLLVPSMVVTDYPRFKWRGMHLDVSRHYFAPQFIKQYIDLLASYKFNTFHWHLVDDQGWRIEIKKYPALTQTGAWRVDHTDKVWGSRPQAKLGEPANYGGYYTQEQIKEIVAYAAERNITVVPEIEMPGHVASAISAYPYLSCTQQKQLPLTGGNYTGMASNYCAGNDSVFEFLENVLTEVMALFPSRYIHIGGDEVDKTSWKKCAKCQQRMLKEHLKDEDELQSYFIKRIERFLQSKKRKIIGWDEILEGGLAPDATVMSWRGEAGGIAAAKMRHNVVMTPGNPVYFDHYQGDPATEPLAIGGFNTLKRVYDYEPLPKELSSAEANYILGAQANLWTEYITTPKKVQYMVLPRMLALSEVLWSPANSKDWSNFNERLQSHFIGFDQKGLHYSKGNFKVDIKPSLQAGKLYATLSTEAYKGQIQYTTDGTHPNINSSEYANPIEINSSVTIKAITTVNGEVKSIFPAEQKFAIHKAIGKQVVYTNPISRYYMADGPNSLTDGIKGTTAVNKFWHGISSKDLIATIDLGEEKKIQTLSLGCLQQYADWIMMPEWVKFEFSLDGIHFSEIGTIHNTVLQQDKTPTIKDFSIQFAPIKARYVRATAKVLNQLPKGHSGEGKPAWIFVDEFIVE